jgi:CTP:molybdopterin cytidylyltransferase MocA
MVEPQRCALLLLAAGGSRRLGEPKQLVIVDGEPLIRRVVRTALAAQLRPTVVVLGARASQIRAHLEGQPVTVVENLQWNEGMASSIRKGVTAALAEAPEIDGIVVMLADQPQLTTKHLAALLGAQRESGRDIVASDYGDHLGPPAYFGRRHFPALLELRGDAGARALFGIFDPLAVAVPHDVSADLDTPEDYSRLVELARLKR